MRVFHIALALIITFTFFPCTPAEAKNQPFVLVIDPGHGGHDPGALCKAKKRKEKEVNLKVSLLLGEYIKKKHPDVKIIYTRSTDKSVDLKERADIANKNKANLFISIHVNAADNRSARGPEVYTFGNTKVEENLKVVKRENEAMLYEDNYEEKYRKFNLMSDEAQVIFELLQTIHIEQSIIFADWVQKELKSCVSWKDRGVRQGRYYVLWETAMPSVLVELDFISNAEAEKYLFSDKGQKRYAKAIADAFTHYKTDFDRKTQTQPAAAPPASSKIYKVQILSTSKPLSAKAKELKGYEADYYQENNLYKYTHGASADFNEISKLRKTLSKDFKDAFIVCFQNGVKVPLN